jgi:hypothetical protein
MSEYHYGSRSVGRSWRRTPLRVHTIRIQNWVTNTTRKGCGQGSLGSAGKDLGAVGVTSVFSVHRSVRNTHRTQSISIRNNSQLMQYVKIKFKKSILATL